jgi:cytochrome c2
MRRLIAAAIAASLCGCSGAVGDSYMPEAKALIAAHCAACHQVPGVAFARGRVGPSLADVGRQQIIAGYFANSPEVLTRWIEHPQELLPGNAMPDMGLSHEQARTIADYLYTVGH